jgi:glycosyltransferase involved in cell wall biosynthesis
MIYYIFNPKPPSEKGTGGAEILLAKIATAISKRGHKVVWCCCKTFDKHYRLENVDRPYEVRAYANFASLWIRCLFLLTNKKSKRDFKLIARCDDTVLIPFPVFGDNVIGICFHFMGRTLFSELSYRTNLVLALIMFALSQLSWWTLGVIFWSGKKIITISNFSAWQIKTRRLTKRISVVREQIAVPSALSSIIKIPKEPIPTLIVISRLVKYKGIQDIIRACKIVESKINLKLWIVGEGPYKKQLIKLAQKVGIRSVRFLGYVSENEKIMLLRRSWLNIVSSRREGFPRTASEGLLVGTPCVLTRKSVIGLFEAGNEVQFTYRAGDYRALAELILKLLCNPDELNRLLMLQSRSPLAAFDEDKMIRAFVKEILS